VRRQILQRDLPAVSLQHPHLRRQVLRHRIGELHLSVLRHVGEQQGSEDLGHRADLEDGVAVDGP
jgi:hypothetical protein